MQTKKYSVCVLLNGDGTKVLLTRKNRTAFAGMLNGVGGKIKEGEEPWEGGLREIKEETAIDRKDITRFSWLGILTIPEQCDLNAIGMYPELWFFTGIVEDESLARKPETETEPIAWYEIDENGHPISEYEVAGDGDVEYFIRMAHRMLFEQKHTVK